MTHSLSLPGYAVLGESVIKLKLWVWCDSSLLCDKYSDSDHGLHCLTGILTVIIVFTLWQVFWQWSWSSLWKVFWQWSWSSLWKVFWQWSWSSLWKVFWQWSRLSFSDRYSDNDHGLHSLTGILTMIIVFTLYDWYCDSSLWQVFWQWSCPHSLTGILTVIMVFTLWQVV